MDTLSTSDSLPILLPKADVPKLKFAGINAQYEAQEGEIAARETIIDRVLAQPIHGYTRGDVPHCIGAAVRTAIAG